MGAPLETFGNYQLIDRLAIGGMAEVFLATVHGEAGFSKPVVIKRLHHRFSEDEEFVRMFIDEAHITAQLLHGNICQVLDLGSVDGAYFMAMEYIAGEDVRTLQDHANRQGVEVPLEAAVFIVSEVLAGLDYAHRKEGGDGSLMGIIHRDVSPQNILISYEGGVKVIDFGIAKARSKVVQTEAGVIKGKFRYMSPEQASGLEVDHRTDIFAAGVVLYELLCGGPHSMDLPETEVLFRMRKAIFDPIKQHRKGVPGELERVVARALKRKAAQRYPDAAEMRADLLDFLTRRRLRFGNSEMAALMRRVFDEDRRRRRTHSSAGETGRGQATGRRPSWTGPTSRRQAAAGPAALSRDHTSGEVLELAAEDLLDEADPRHEPAYPVDQPWQPPPGHGDRPGSELELMPTSAYLGPGALPEVRQPAGWKVSGQVEQPGGSPEPARAPGPGPRRQSSGAGAFSRQPDPGGPVIKEPGRVQMPGAAAAAPEPGAWSRQHPHASQRQAETGAREAASGPGGGSGLRTFLGSLAVLLLGAGALWALYRYQPAFLGLEPSSARRADSGAAAAVAGDGTRGQPLPEPPKKSGARLRRGMLRVRSNPGGAAVSLCDRPTGKVTPVNLEIPRGSKPCTILLTLQGYEPYSLPAVAHGDEPITVVATLRKISSTFAPEKPTHPTPPRPARGQLRITSIQPGAVLVNGQEMGQTPRLELTLRPGTYLVRVRFSGLRQSPDRQVLVVAGKLKTLHFEGE